MPIHVHFDSSAHGFYKLSDYNVLLIPSRYVRSILQVPTTFAEMFHFNAAVMGFNSSFFGSKKMLPTTGPSTRDLVKTRVPSLDGQLPFVEESSLPRSSKGQLSSKLLLDLYSWA